MILNTDNPDLPAGYGLTFTLGRGNEIVSAMCALCRTLPNVSADASTSTGSLFDKRLNPFACRCTALEHLVVGLSLEDDILSDLMTFSRTLTQDGQLRWIGPDQRRVVEIADPRDRSRAALRLSVDGGSVATTCNSERRRIVDGRPLGHLIDPRTGRPAADFGAVSVWTREAIDADCLSTACFVLGPDAALALAERLDGVEIVVLRCEEDSGALTARLSSGLKGRVTGLLSELEQLL